MQKMPPPAFPSAHGPGPPPGAAARAAARREPILLQGFDRRRQYDIQFGTITFGAIWLRRTYTNEHHRHVTQRTRYDEPSLQELRYGNNITVLLKACFYLRQFYDLPDFWSAISKGFGASADVVRDMVELLVDARNIYRRNNPHEVDIDRTGANIAADKWHSFLVNRDIVDTHWGNENTQEVQSRARAFFTELEGKQVDLANVLPKGVDYQHYSPSSSRKRFASPEPPGHPPSPKRRSSSSYVGRPEPLSSRPTQSLAPLTTGIQIKGSAKQDYHTPISATEYPAQAMNSAHDSPTKATEAFRKIRGTASQDRIGLPSNNSQNSALPLAPSNESPDVEKQRLREQLAWLQKEVSDVKSRQSNDQELRMKMDRILTERLHQHVKPLRVQIATLEKKVAEGEARQVQVIQDIRDVKDCINIVKGEISVKTGDLTCSHNQNYNSTLQALESVQGRLSLLEEKIVVEESTGTQAKASFAESRTFTSQPTSQEPSVPDMHNVTNSPTRLEDEITVAGASTGARELWANYQSLENRVTNIELKSDEGEHIRGLVSKLAVIEQEQCRAKKEYATKDYVETTFKPLYDRITCENGSIAKQLQYVDMHTTTQMQSSRLTKPGGVLRTSKSPSPSQDAQQTMDELLKTINSLPTEASVTHMISKRDQISRSENEGLQRIVKDLSTKISTFPTAISVSDMIQKQEQFSTAEIEGLRRSLDDLLTKVNNLPNIAFVSDRTFRLEQNLRSELQKHQKDTNELVNGNLKTIETLQVQIKGLNKLWNELSTGVATSNSLLALKVEVDALKADVAIQSKRLDVPNQGLDRSKDDILAKLDHRVTDLSAQMRTALSGGTLADLSKQVQECHNKVDAMRSTTKVAKIDVLAVEVETLYQRTSMLAKALSGMGELIRPP